MSTARNLHYSYAEYLSVEECNPTKHEFCSGEIYAMAGGTPEHAALSARAMALLTELFPRCTTFSSDARIRISSADLTTYPDASIVCGRVDRAKEDRLALTNPLVLVEVTSASTEEYDRGVKLRAYLQLPSLRAVLLVSHLEPRVTLHTRGGSAWTHADFRSGENVTFEGVCLSVDRLYSALDGFR